MRQRLSIDRRVFIVCVVVLFCGLLLRPVAAAQDLNTMLTKFLQDLVSGTLGNTQVFSAIALKSNTASISMGTSSDTVITRTAAGKVSLTGTTPMIQIGGTSSSFPALKQSGAGVQVRLADDSAFASFNAGSIGINTAGNGLFFTGLLASATAPSSPASCGSSAAVTTANGSASFLVTSGTGGTATGCTLTMPTATTGWNCFITNITQTAAHRADRGTVQTASTTTSVTWEYVTLSTGAATAFTASDVFRGICFAY